MSDRITSYLRTYVPKIYGYLLGLLVAWLGANAPGVLEALEFLGVDLSSPLVVGTVVAAVVGLVEAAYYYVMRRLEPRLPDWLTRALLGSSKAPTYAPVTADGVHVVTSLPAETLPTHAIIRTTGLRAALADALEATLPDQGVDDEKVTSATDAALAAVRGVVGT